MKNEILKNSMRHQKKKEEEKETQGDNVAKVECIIMKGNNNNTIKNGIFYILQERWRKIYFFISLTAQNKYTDVKNWYLCLYLSSTFTAPV